MKLLILLTLINTIFAQQNNVNRKISDEAYSNPDIVKNSPHNASIHKVIKSDLTIKKDIYVTWRQYKKSKKLD